MGGLFGVASKNDCVKDLFFGVDYHSHLGTKYGGLAVWDGEFFNKEVHSIENTQFRTIFEDQLKNMTGNIGIGCISDSDPQPMVITSHLGRYAISTVGRIFNKDEIVKKLLGKKQMHFLQNSGKYDNTTEIAASLIDSEESFTAGIKKAQDEIYGSCSIMILTPDAIYAARDLHGRTPLIIAKSEDSYCVTFETCALHNLGYTQKYELGPGEIVKITADGYEVLSAAKSKMRMCAFLWVYYGYPSSQYEGMNVEVMRYRSGAHLAARDKDITLDMVTGMPDSGVAHAIGYSNSAGVPFGRPFIKYTPTWARSFMPQDQSMRNLVARMKMMPITELVNGKRLLLIDDSIVRGTQLIGTNELLYKANAKEIHMRPACPPLTFGCKFLNFSNSKDEYDLITRRTIRKLEGENADPTGYAVEKSDKYETMVASICKELNLTTLRYQYLDDTIDSIGLSCDKLCTYCWSGKE